ncbi:MAG: prepilin peptidase [Sedimentisphaerales bacterium]|nr:prepilin peptidase [Sedimentisphaerales bacterium]
MICAFVFALGCIIGSFLNVVIYRLPREKSLVTPGSACPACGKPIRFYDNVPLVSWLLLGAKCRHCKARISARYFVVELLTGTLFLGLYLLYFHTGIRPIVQVTGGWLVYVVHVILLAAFLAASAIDLELWVIPLSICWTVTAVGLVGSTVAGLLIEPDLIQVYGLFPAASPLTGALALGGVLGLCVSWLLLKTGLLKRSYEVPDEVAQAADDGPEKDVSAPALDDYPFQHRREACLEVLFLAPIMAGVLLAWLVTKGTGPVATWWAGLLDHAPLVGLLGSVFGYFVGCAVVWTTRILGTLAFGKEAMGLGDVHLMGAAGAVVGPMMIVIAFFIAPFFGLGWAFFQMFFKKTRQIPYGPFLSLAVFTVMIFHDWIWNRFAALFLG